MSPAPLTLRTVVCARSNQVSSAVGEDLVILDLDSSMYYSLDPVGRRIFELLQVPARLDDVVGDVVAEFEIDAETAGADVLAFVSTLLEQQLVGTLLEQQLVEPRPTDAR